MTKKDNDDYNAVNDNTVSVDSSQPVQELSGIDLFGNEVIMKKKNPARGYQYLVFTVIMVIILSIMVITE